MLLALIAAGSSLTMATCEGLIKRMGFECREVGGTTLVISTPFTYLNGEPVGFYLVKSDQSVRISDNSDTLAHFAAIGYDISTRQRWKGIKQTVEAFGLQMLTTGEIVGSEPKQCEDDLITRYLTAMLAVIDYERQYLGLSPPNGNLRQKENIL